MNEKDFLGLKLNESLRTEDGGRYTRTLGGWIYTNFAGNILLIPEPSVVKENLTTEKAEKKAKEK